MLTLPMMTAGMGLHSGEQVRASPGRNPTSYKVIVPTCYTVSIIIFVILTVGVNAGIIWLTLFNQSIFTAAKSWCFVSPKMVYDQDYNYVENPCIDSDKYLDSQLPSSAIFNDAPCQYTDSDTTASGFDNFCSTASQPYSWCQNIYDTVVDTTPGNCGDLEIGFLTSANFSTYADNYFCLLYTSDAADE